jgi:hypothetical protein
MSIANSVHPLLLFVYLKDYSWPVAAIRDTEICPYPIEALRLEAEPQTLALTIAGTSQNQPFAESQKTAP